MFTDMMRALERHVAFSSEDALTVLGKVASRALMLLGHNQRAGDTWTRIRKAMQAEISKLQDGLGVFNTLSEARRRIFKQIADIATLKRELENRKSFIDGQTKAIEARDKCITAKDAILFLLYEDHEKARRYNENHILGLPSGPCICRFCKILPAKWQDFLDK